MSNKSKHKKNDPDLESLVDPGFWLELNSELGLSVDGSAFTELDGQPSIGSLDKNWKSKLIDEGLLNLGTALDATFLNALKDGVYSIVKRKLLPIYAIVYDEYWDLLHYFETLAEPILGTDICMPSSVWIWYIDQKKGDAGFTPHRDRPQYLHDTNKLPKSVTLWTPLTDADPLNGCMYAIPAHLDKNYNDNANPKPIDMQDIRALPAKAGSVIIWNQRVLHWGGKSARHAQEPRISIAIELQRKDWPAAVEPLLKLKQKPSFNMRLKIIGRSILFYRDRYGFSEQEISVFHALENLPAADAPPDW